MKTLLLTAAGAAALLCACSGQPRRATTELETYRDSIPAVDTARAIADSVLPPLPPVTSQGVGPVRLGMEIADVPRQLTGLYDTVEVSRGGSGEEAWATLHFLLDSCEIMTADASGTPMRIASIGVIGRGPGVTVGNEKISVGADARRVARMPGILGGGDNAGDYLEWRGVIMAIDADTIAALTIVR